MHLRYISFRQWNENEGKEGEEGGRKLGLIVGQSA